MKWFICPNKAYVLFNIFGCKPFRMFYIFCLFFLFCSLSAYADITSGVELQFAVSTAQDYDGIVDNVRNIARIVINCALFVGLFPVVRSLSTDGDKGSKMLIGWLVGVIVANIAMSII